jgi:hypothetical protein
MLTPSERRALTDKAVSLGTSKPPRPPRDVTAQAGSRGALLTWKLPEDGGPDVTGYRVYKNNEDTLYEEVQDRGRRQEFVELSAGTPTSTKYPLFVSCLNAAGRESQKVQVIASASPETGAPALPDPPPGYGDEGSGGGDRRYYGWWKFEDPL